jgi:hypothetical protein
MSENKPTSQDINVKAECENCRRSREHFSVLLAFDVVEKILDKPLRIRGIAMAVGMSRNSNIYTPQELETFSSKLVNAPVYIEHVAVPNAIGKVTQTNWDGHSLLYEAEIYESDVADKISKGLVQHVSVGADYEAVDLVDGKVPHGLHNAELSLVAVPGIPETNVQVLEKLSPADAAKLTDEVAEVKSKLVEAETKLADNMNKLGEAQKTIESLPKQLPGGGLFKDPPKMMPVSEHITVLEGLLPAPIVEKSTMGVSSSFATLTEIKSSGNENDKR